MTLADRRPLTNAYEPPLPAVRRWSICGAGLGFGPQSSQTGSQTCGATLTSGRAVAGAITSPRAPGLRNSVVSQATSALVSGRFRRCGAIHSTILLGPGTNPNG